MKEGIKHKKGYKAADLRDDTHLPLHYYYYYYNYLLFGIVGVAWENIIRQES